MSITRLLCGALTLACAMPVAAQTAPPETYPAAAQGDGATTKGYNLSRWAEDWSAYRDPAKRDDILDRLKYLPLDDDGDIYLTLSGEARLRMNLTKACGHLSHGDLQSCEVDHSSVALIGFLVSGGDPPECFEAAEEVLDEVPPAISVKVAFDLLLSVRFGRDHRYSASFVQLGSQPICVESLVSEEHIEFDVLDQRFHSDEVMALARHQYETGQVSQRIYQRHDLCGQPSARPSDRLTMSPPLAPVPC